MPCRYFKKKNVQKTLSKLPCQPSLPILFSPLRKTTELVSLAFNVFEFFNQMFIIFLSCLLFHISKYSGDLLLPRWDLPRRKKGQKVREFWVLQHMVDLNEAHSKPKNFRVSVDSSIC